MIAAKNRKISLLSVFGAIFLAVGPNLNGVPAPPNFVVILGEGSGWTSSSVQMDDRNPESRGVGIQTPNLERLAAGGMRFSTSALVVGASRSAFSAADLVRSYLPADETGTRKNRETSFTYAVRPR